MLQNKLKSSLLALVIIPTFTFAVQCTQDERIGLKENGYSQKEIVELCGEEQKKFLPNKYMSLKIGSTISSSDKTTEASLVLGIDNKQGFDVRGIFSIGKTIYLEYEDYQSDFFLIGLDIAYNFNPKVALFTGIQLPTNSNKKARLEIIGIDGKFTESFGYFTVVEVRDELELMLGLSYTF